MIYSLAGTRQKDVEPENVGLSAAGAGKNVRTDSLEAARRVFGTSGSCRQTYEFLTLAARDMIGGLLPIFPSSSARTDSTWTLIC
jgi:hypothetical protein